MFKKKILSFLILGIFAFSMFAVVGSVDAGDSVIDTIKKSEEFGGVATEVFDETANSNSVTRSIQDYVANIINAILGLLGVIFLILILYAGFLWMTAAGSEDKVTKAKQILTQAIIGIVIVTAAYAISFFVLQALAEVA